MPLFRYKCKDCDFEFELLLARFDSPAECPECGSENLEKQLNKIAAIVSGSKTSCALQSKCPSSGASCCNSGCCGKH